MPQADIRTRSSGRVGLLVLPDITGIAFFGLHEMLSQSGLDTVVVAPEAGMLRSATGLAIAPEVTLARAPRDLDIIIVPNIELPPDRPLTGKFDAAAAWLRARFEAGALITSACSGSLLLAEAGLLDDREATTHWYYVDTFRRFYPRVRLQPERVLVMTGPHGRIVTAGGAASWNDLALFLVARKRGGAEAVRTAKLHLINWHAEGQTPFASMRERVSHADAAIRRAERWLARHHAEKNPVEGAMLEAGLPERTFKRRFKQATGHAPIAYVHALRIERAKELLERGAVPVDEIAHQVGYADASFFRRLFRREVGVTPATYRRRFGPVYAGLTELAGRRPARADR